MKDRIIQYLRAGFAGLYLVTSEEARAEQTLARAAEELSYRLYSWDPLSGLADIGAGSVRPMADPVDAVQALGDLPDRSLLLLRDFHLFLGDRHTPPSPVLIRAVKDALRSGRTSARALVILACSRRLPDELQREFAVLEPSLPGADDLAVLASDILTSGSMGISADLCRQAADAARGLTTVEAEDVMALSLVSRRCLDPSFIAAEKARMLGRDGLLELIEPAETADDIGGLEVLKKWLVQRRRAFTPEAREFGLPLPRGVLITGVPGTGKSLTAKAASSVLAQPILRLDAGRLFGGFVGDSEANIRRALRTAEAIAPCILWIDEMEKGLAGGRGGGSTDGGTSARVFGTLLSWMQERTDAVFVVATANEVRSLAPELLRKGRFDEVFFVDLPSCSEREAIWRIHLRRRGRDPEGFDLQALAAASTGFTGAEIEQVVIEALFACFEAGSDLTPDELRSALSRTVPLSVTRAEELAQLRRWAEGRTRNASAGGSDEGETVRRRQIAA